MILWAVFNVLATIAGAILATTVLLFAWMMIDSGLWWLAAVIGVYMALSLVWIIRGKIAERRAAVEAEAEGQLPELG